MYICLVYNSLSKLRICTWVKIINVAGSYIIVISGVKLHRIIYHVCSSIEQCNVRLDTAQPAAKAIHRLHSCCCCSCNMYQDSSINVAGERTNC